MILRRLRYMMEGIFLLISMSFFRLLPLDIASALGGLLARIIGPFTRAHTVARMNMARTLSHTSERERAYILRGMWDNLGRVMGEYPHLARPEMRRRITVEGREHLEQLRASGKGAIFVSGHFANWEIAPLTAALCGMPLSIVYRTPNNPVADWLTRRIRSHYSHSMHRKGKGAAREILRALRAGQVVALHVDQKMNDGEPVTFFGEKAMTATTAVELAIKLQLPLIAARVVRTDGAYFHVTALPALTYTPGTAPPMAMEALHRIFEDWIRERPEQWFWVHNRWNFARLIKESS